MDTTLLESQSHILVIDDNPSIHEDFRKILGLNEVANPALEAAELSLFGAPAEPMRRACFAIDSAYQGSEGLALVQRAEAAGRPYALAFVDVRMPPGWDGIETVQRIWSAHPDLQVVICTAYSDYSWDEMMGRLGRSDSLVILRKPFDNIEVLQLAHALSKKWLLARQVRGQMEELNRVVAERTLELQTTNAKLRSEVAERTQAETALRLLEERFSKAFRASPIPMAIQTLAAGRYVDVNESFLRMTGLTLEAVIGRDPAATPGGFLDMAWLSLVQAMQHRRSIRNFEGCFRDQAGNLHATLVFAEVFDLGVEPHVLVIVQDVTERIKLEQQLRQSQKMEAVGQLASGIAHDFNNILTVIQGHAALVLLRDQLDREVAESAREISAASERAAALTRKLLTFCRREMTRPQVVHLNQSLTGLGNMLRRLIGEHILIQYALAPELPPVFGDPSNLEQVILNLVVNARDAMPGGGSITITTAALTLAHADLSRHPQARHGLHVCLDIADTGCGMPPAVLERIFEPFYTTKEAGKGTGLGLSTVYGIVKQHGGWIEVVSEPGKGSRFRVFLPATDKAAPSLPPDLLAPVPVATGGRILLVEDEAAVRKMAAKILRASGYEVLEAADGGEAVRVWERNPAGVDLLLTDVIMPGGVSGWELAKELTHRKPELKVLYTSGYNAEAAGYGMANQPNFEFLEKPYQPPALIQAVVRCLQAEPAPA